MRLLERYTSLAIRHRWAFIAFVLLATGVLGYFGTKVQTNFSPDALFLTDDPEMTVVRAMNKMFGESDSTIYVVYHDPSLFTPEGLILLDALTQNLKKAPRITRVESLTDVNFFRGEEGAFVVDQFLHDPPFTPEECSKWKETLPTHPFFGGYLAGKHGEYAAVVLKMEEGIQEDKDKKVVCDQVEALTAEVLPKGVEYYIAGIPPVEGEYFRLVRDDQGVFLVMINVMFFALLLYIFRSFDGVFLPLLFSGLSFIMLTGAAYFLGFKINIISTAIPTIILVYGLADSIHILSRYREEYHHNQDKQTAILKTFQAVGMACFMTSFTTFIGFASLLTANLHAIRDFGSVSGTGVMICWAVTMLAMPGMLSLWKAPKMSSLSSPTTHTKSWLDKFLDRTERWVIRHTKATLYGCAGFMVLCLGLSTQVHRDSRLLEEIWPENRVAKATTFIEENFSGVLPIEILVTASEEGGLYDPKVMEGIERITQFLPTTGLVEKSFSPSLFTKSMNEAMHEGNPEFYKLPDSREAIAQYFLLAEMGDDPELLRPFISEDGKVARIVGMRKDLGSNAYFSIMEQVNKVIETFDTPGVEFRVTGLGLVVNHAVKRMVQDLMTSVFTAFFFIALAIGLEFKSAKIALLSVIPNLFPLATTMAFMTIGGIELRIATAILFSVALGIAVDDTIHLIVRYREEFWLTDNPEAAARRAIVTAGKPIMFTSTVIIAGFAVLLMSNFRGIYHFGMLTCTTLLAALVADLYLTPALLIFFKVRFPKPKENSG